MRVAGHDVLHVVVGDVEQGIDEGAQMPAHVDDAVLCVQAEVGRDLVVAGAGGVHGLADRADAPDEFVFHEGVDVFRALDLKRSLFDVGEDVDERVADLFRVLFGDDLRFSQHLDVRDAREDIVPIQFVVERKRLVEVIGALGARLRKTSFPQFHKSTLRN